MTESTPAIPREIETPSLSEDDALMVPEVILSLGEHCLYWFPETGVSVVGNIVQATLPVFYDSLPAGMLGILYAAHGNTPEIFEALWNGMAHYSSMCQAVEQQEQILRSVVVDTRH